MGFRYDFELTANVKENAPETVVRLLAYLLGTNDEQPTEVPSNWSFDGNWEDVRFKSWAHDCDPAAGDPICSFHRVHRFSQKGVDHDPYTLHLRFATNAEYLFEVALPFASWLATWSEQDVCVGSYQEEFARHPTLLYFHDGKLYVREVSEPPECVDDGTLWT